MDYEKRCNSMRKKLISVLAISIVALSTSVSFAGEYTLKDMTISIDDSVWYVFTRDNLLNNPDLEELGIEYYDLANYMTENDVLMEACKFDSYDEKEDIDLLVVIKKVDNIQNAHIYDDEFLNEAGGELKELVGANDYDICTIGKYKFIHVQYYDSAIAYNINEYYTVINGYGYSIMEEKMNIFSSAEQDEFKNILDSTVFKIDPQYEKLADTTRSNSSNLWLKILGGVIVAAVCNLIWIFVKSKKVETNQELPIENNEVPEETEEKCITANTSRNSDIEGERQNANTEKLSDGRQNSTDAVDDTKQGTQVDKTAIAVACIPSVCFCRECGTKLAENALFCPECGTKVITVNEMFLDIDADKEKSEIITNSQESLHVSEEVDVGEHGSLSAINFENKELPPLLRRAFLLIEDEEWDKAEAYLEKILDEEPENAFAYLGKLLVERRSVGPDALIMYDLFYNKEDVCLSGNFKKAKRFAKDVELKAFLEQFE